MNQRNLDLAPTALALVLALAAGSAAADPVLRWAPADTLIAPGQEATLAVVLDDTLDVRTIELFVQFDPAILTTVAGGAGELFDGFNNFTDFSEESPGLWHGYCVILGANDWTTGPGELFTITVAGAAVGVSPLVTQELTLLPPGGGAYEEAVLPDGQVRVDDASAAPVAAAGPARLALYPNPFNPRTRLELRLPGGGPVRLEVVDLRGRVVAEPWRGTAGEALVVVDWTACDRAGRPLPSGAYAFRLVGPRGTAAVVAGVLLR